ncbi:MAG: trimethylamine methyltransferase family protein [Rhodospirillaceae bacterium]|nr:trimethylamine methyltransferase family protein [Rhodospirillaceae bacterium]MDE0616151.1 trimethylamine methyltransferase family protein [Rhodospirillaceae bacterium]
MADLTSSTDRSPRTELSAGTRERRRRGRARDRSMAEAARPERKVDYRRLVNPFEPVRVYSDDRIAAIHDTALKVLEELGMRLLLPAALDLLRAKGRDGVSIDDGARHCRFDRGLVAEAIATAPSEWTLHGGAPETSSVWGGRHVVWCAVGGAPHISDLDGGKRPGTMEDSRNIMRLCEHYDVMHVQGPNVEAQDIDTAFRHLEVTRAQLVLSAKAPFVYCRGKGQVADGMKMVQIARGLSEEAFRAAPYVYTVINTNSPLVLDRPMLQGIMDYAEHGQPILLTPFTLSGAMAPVTIPGALVQQHAEFLAGLVISQLTRPGAPVCYGGFTSNVAMRSGAPAFGTPENVRAAFASGQLARLVGVPWRSSGSCTANCVDAQAVYETQMALWGATLGGANFVAHAAGWMEGGLTGSMEKFIVDIEMLQQMAELMQPVAFDEDDLAFEAMRDVGSGGHFFGTPHTMERYETAFYEPFLSDWSNFNQWTENGAVQTPERANAIWKKVLNEFEPPEMDVAVREALDDFVARRTAEGGAPPLT